MAKSSSTNKAAKLAQKGKGQRIRFQGGTLFPLIVAVVLTLGVAGIAAARLTVPDAADLRPNIDDHWHVAYGFYLCDSWYQLAGNLEDVDVNGRPVNADFLRTGIHSHDDGTMHWHPGGTSAAVGSNAVLGVFLDVYDVELTNDSIKFPENNVLGSSDEYVEGETQCNGEDAEVAVKTWDSFADTGNGNRYIAEMDRVRIAKDQMVIAIYFTPPDADQVMPPWAQQLPQNAANDIGGEPPNISIAPTISIVPPDPAATVPAGSVLEPTSG